MTQVSFYALKSSDSETRLRFTCRLIEKAYSLGHDLYIQTESPEQAKALDEMLWQFSPPSFVPHCLADTGSDISESVTIGAQLPGDRHKDVLINLRADPSEAHQQFKRINEIMSADEESLQQGRKRYRFYQDQGYQTETFKL